MGRQCETSIELEVPFHDVDPMGVVWHGHYYKYLELARTELLRSRRLDVPDLLELGLGFIMIESGCRYAAPLRYGDRVRVAAWFRNTGAAAGAPRLYYDTRRYPRRRPIRRAAARDPDGLTSSGRV